MKELNLEDLKNLEFEENGQVMLGIGLLVTLYFENAYQSHMRKALAQFYHDYWERCGSHLHWCTDLVSHKWKKAAPISREKLGHFLAELDDDDAWSISCHGGEQIKDASEFSFEIACIRAWQEKSTKLSYITASMPLLWFTEHGGSLIEITRQWSEKIKPYHGYAGLGIISPLDTIASTHAEPRVYALARRFPGMEVDYPLDHSLHLKAGIKGINWLTVLADQWVEKVGGLEQLQSNLDDSFVVHNYPGGIVIQAGDRPQLGDVNRKNIPEAYQKISRLLKPIRVDYPVGLHRWSRGGERFDPERTKQWQARFD